MTSQLLFIVLIFLCGIALLFFNSAEIFGFYYATREETDEHEQEVLWWFHALCRWYLGEYWIKPICGCPVCMGSIHSLVVWIPIYIIMPFSMWLIYVHLIYVCCLAGINYIITSIRGLDL